MNNINKDRFVSRLIAVTRERYQCSCKYFLPAYATLPRKITSTIKIQEKSVSPLKSSRTQGQDITPVNEETETRKEKRGGKK